MWTSSRSSLVLNKRFSHTSQVLLTTTGCFCRHSRSGSCSCRAPCRENAGHTQPSHDFNPTQKLLTNAATEALNMLSVSC